MDQIRQDRSGYWDILLGNEYRDEVVDSIAGLPAVFEAVGP